MSHFAEDSNAANDAAEWRAESRRSLATDRELSYGENAPTRAELEDDR